MSDQLPNPISGPNAWPLISGLKPTLAHYSGNILTRARKLIRLFALVLDLPATYFDGMFARPGAMCCILQHPPQAPTASTSTLGIRRPVHRVSNVTGEEEVL